MGRMPRWDSVSFGCWRRILASSAPKSPTQSLLQMPPATPHNHGHGTQNHRQSKGGPRVGGSGIAWETWGEVLEGKERLAGALVGTHLQAGGQSPGRDERA